MKRWNQIAGCTGTVFGALLVAFSLRLKLGSWTEPGPGFTPMGVGVLLIILCILYVVGSIRGKDQGGKEESPWPRENLGKIIGVLISLFLFAFVLPFLGFLPATFLLMVYLFRVVESERWFVTVFKAVVSVGITYVIFERWLMVQFPKGFWQI
jgi:putative tricarboxylic transport membrane protein